MNLAQQQNNLGTVSDLSKFACISLCHQSTAIEPMKRPEAELDGPNLQIERDDFTGLAIGGNKTRKLEFWVGIAQNTNMLLKH